MIVPHLCVFFPSSTFLDDPQNIFWTGVGNFSSKVPCFSPCSSGHTLLLSQSSTGLTHDSYQSTFLPPSAHPISTTARLLVLIYLSTTHRLAPRTSSVIRHCLPRRSPAHHAAQSQSDRPSSSLTRSSAILCCSWMILNIVGSFAQSNFYPSSRYC